MIWSLTGLSRFENDLLKNNIQFNTVKLKYRIVSIDYFVFMNYKNVAKQQQQVAKQQQQSSNQVYPSLHSLRTRPIRV